ncbi:tRNA pseudouridine(38-40) synthase TruA [Zhouia sp. PK063]|uniref:tRNA pseudouridine(38-40) synthase TruA n=1 Tax=Zhouia sp. PK063 TaxID=3373602 RepID=UPI00378750A0
MRYFIEFSYFGKAYHGWQRQPNAISVQQVLEEGLSTILRSNLTVIGAGRTDAGVHAKQMFAHFDVAQPLEIGVLHHKLNSYLPKDIAIHEIFEVNDDAHARFDAVSRTYEYWIVFNKNPFYTDFAYHLKQEVSVAKMNEAAKVLFDYTDFKCFSKSNTDVKTYHCKIMQASWEMNGDTLVFTVKADRFLRNMVRAIVGTLLTVGMDKATVADVKKIIESKNRSKAGVSVPAQGLYLTKVEYPSAIKK